MGGKRFLEGTSPAERAAKRQKMGTLKQLTVQPSTRNRYQKATDRFLLFLKLNQLKLPSKRDQLDPLVCDFLEHLWSSGEGRAVASDCVAGLQNQDAKLRGQLPGSWRLLKAWATNEIPNRAPPFPEHVVHALCGWAIFNQHYSFAVSLLVGFYGMLRTGELLGVHRSDCVADSGDRKVLLSLGLTKAGKRAGAAESVILGHDKVVKPLRRWMYIAQSFQSLTPSPAKWRSLFAQGISALKLDSLGFRPYSLRRGGATWWFSRHHSLDQILLQGRWQAAKTARIYINEGLAVLAEIQLPSNDARIAPFLRVYHAKFANPTFTTLEPPRTLGSTGGRGRGKKSKRFSRKKKGVYGLFLVLSLKSYGLGSGPSGCKKVRYDEILSLWVLARGKKIFPLTRPKGRS